jgi:hypothetical protein
MSSVGYPSNPCTFGSDGVNLFWFDPGKYVWLVDDFVSSNGNNTLGLNWNTSGDINTSVSSASATNPGIIQIQIKGSNATSAINLQRGIILGGGAITQRFIVQIPVLSSSGDNNVYTVGMADSNNAQPNGVYFTTGVGISQGTNWFINTSNSGTRTTQDSGVAVTTGFVDLKIMINAAGTSASFFINGTQTSNSPISTNLPTSAIGPQITMSNFGNFTTNENFNIDLFNQLQILTTSR